MKRARGDVGDFIEMAAEYLEEVRAGILHWRESWANNSIADVVMEIHRCKGGASLFAFERLHALFRELEDAISGGVFELAEETVRQELVLAEQALAALREPA